MTGRGLKGGHVQYSPIFHNLTFVVDRIIDSTIVSS
jgi:hypothetical protein